MKGSRIKQLREEKGLTQPQLAEILKISSSAIAMYETDKREPSDDIKLKICQFFNCTMDYLVGLTNIREPIEGIRLDNSSEEHKKHFYGIYEYILEHNKKDEMLENSLSEKIPVVGKIAAGQPVLATEYLEGYLPVDPNIYGLKNTKDLFYLRVNGQSMNMKIKNGDYALIHKQNYAEDGDIVVAIVNDDNEATLKRYKKINEQFVLLEPMSTDSTIQSITIDLKNTNFQIIGKAIGHFGKF